MENVFDKKYKIGLYNLPYNYKRKLIEYINNSSDNIFEIIEIGNFNKIENYPNLILIDINELITSEIKKCCNDNMIQIVRITDRPISVVTNNDIVISFSNEFIDHNFINLEDTNITYFEYSIKILKNLTEINNNKRNNKILNNEEYQQLINSLIKMIYVIDSKDHYTKLHSLNVAKYAMLLGKELNLSDHDIEILRVGGMLHDIGKIGIPDDILNKNAKLTDNEYRIIKRHPILGEILLPEEYKKIKEIIRNHHERYDGRGYPDGLRGENIPLLVRIVSIADTFDAMTTKRTYNERKTIDEALNELYKCSRKEINEFGKLNQQFDPKLVEKFIIAIKKDIKIPNKKKNK